MGPPSLKVEESWVEEQGRFKLRIKSKTGDKSVQTIPSGLSIDLRLESSP